MTTSDRIHELWEIAERATPGPWHYCTANGGKCKCGIVSSEAVDAPVATCNKEWGDGTKGTESWMEHGSLKEGDREANAQHIATFDPPTALKLLRIAAATDWFITSRELVGWSEDDWRELTEAVAALSEEETDAR